MLDLGLGPKSEKVYPEVVHLKQRLPSILDEATIAHKAMLQELELMGDELPAGHPFVSYPPTRPVTGPVYPDIDLWDDITRERIPYLVIPGVGRWERLPRGLFLFGKGSAVSLVEEEDVYAITGFSDAWAIRYTPRIVFGVTSLRETIQSLSEYTNPSKMLLFG